MKPIRSFITLLLLSILPACTVITSSPSRVASLPANNRVPHVADAQDPLTALSAIRQAVAAGTPENLLAAEYLETLTDATRRAETLMNEGALEKAGVYLQAAINGYPRQINLARQAPLPLEQLREMRNTCADRLMENGLLAYRSGDLDKAISIWDNILSFHPQHEASQKAIQTANLQRDNLKALDKVTP